MNKKLLLLLLLCIPILAMDFGGGIGGGVSEGVDVLSSGETIGTVLTAGGDGTSSWIAPAGGGDVTGPGSSVDGHVCSYNGATGKIIKDGGAVNIDGALFTGPTSGPSLSIITGSSIPGLTAGGMTVYGMSNGTSISGAGNTVSQVFGSENLLALVTPPTASTVAGQNIGNNLTTLVNSQLIGVGVINKVQSVTDSYISGKDAGSAATLGGTSWDNVILVGRNAGTTNDYGAASSLVAFGRGGIFSTFDSPTGEIMFGSSGQPMPDMYFGEGAGSASPSTDVRIQPTGAIGGFSTDLAATGDMIIAGARGTGTEDGSEVLIQIAPGGSSGTTLNTLVTAFRALVDGTIEITIGPLNLNSKTIINTASVSAAVNNVPDSSQGNTLELHGGNKTGGDGDGGPLDLFSGNSSGGIDGFVVVKNGLFRISTGDDAGDKEYNIRTAASDLIFESTASGISPVFNFRPVDFDGTDSINMGIESDSSSFLKFIYSQPLDQYRLSTNTGDDLHLQAGLVNVIVLKVDRSLEIDSGGVQTTDATLTTAHTFPTVSDTSYTLTSTCTMKSSSAANGGIVIRAAFKNVSGTVTQIGATDAVSTFEENAATASAFSISGVNILTRVTGIAATTIDWNCGQTFTKSD